MTETTKTTPVPDHHRPTLAELYRQLRLHLEAEHLATELSMRRAAHVESRKLEAECAERASELLIEDRQEFERILREHLAELGELRGGLAEELASMGGLLRADAERLIVSLTHLMSSSRETWGGLLDL